jgi:2-polyprenyl-3-methyl-5-hydroxy-6-metoxy-1,4-benzoquinol methylase
MMKSVLNYRYNDMDEVAGIFYCNFVTGYSVCFAGKFDLIECRHVLEHLIDPAAGLEQLVSLLKEDGAISLSLHAE